MGVDAGCSRVAASVHQYCYRRTARDYPHAIRGSGPVFRWCRGGAVLLPSRRPINQPVWSACQKRGKLIRFCPRLRGLMKYAVTLLLTTALLPGAENPADTIYDAVRRNDLPRIKAVISDSG